MQTTRMRTPLLAHTAQPVMLLCAGLCLWLMAAGHPALGSFLIVFSFFPGFAIYMLACRVYPEWGQYENDQFLRAELVRQFDTENRTGFPVDEHLQKEATARWQENFADPDFWDLSKEHY